MNRRKLGRGQHPALPGTTVVVTDTMDTATLTFAAPVVVSGPINLAVTGGVTPVTQTTVSPTVVTILYSGPLTTLHWTFSSDEPVRTYQGGQVAAATGTFS